MISIQNISFSYAKKKSVLSEANLEVQGGIIGLFGKNGTGKSTLLYLLQGLLKPKDGTVSVLGQDPFRRSASLLASVYLLPEQFTVSPKMSLETYVNMMAPFYPSFDMEAMEELYPQVKLEKTMKLGELSMGMQKMFLIAFGLSTRCKILLFDEPTNGLDIPNKMLFRKLLIKNSDPAQTILISTHQVKDIEDVVEHILILHDGKFLLDMDMIQLSENYSFGFSTSLPSQAFYHERHGGGFHFIRNASEQPNEQTAVNIELLFNACTQYQLPHLQPKEEYHGQV